MGFVSVDVSLVLELVNVLTGKDFCHFNDFWFMRSINNIKEICERQETEKLKEAIE